MTEVTGQGLLRRPKLHVGDTGGTGRPIVLIHGWPLSSASWSAQVDALRSAGHRVITYDRRGFGRSDKPKVGYTYEGLSDDLSALMEELDLHDTTLVGFSMGGGEVASYCARFGVARLRSVVFASSVTPFMLTTKRNPDGPLGKKAAAQLALSLTTKRIAFYDQFISDFYSVGGVLQVREDERQKAVRMCHQAGKVAALGCLIALGHTDFREDLARVSVPSLVIHGDGDQIVPLTGSGQRTHDALPDSRLHVIEGGPHGVNVSHAEQFNDALLAFLGADLALAR